MIAIAVRPLLAADFPTWRDAYGAYAVAVNSPVDDAIALRVFAWIVDPQHALCGIAAIADERLAGFAHVRAFPRTLDGNVAGYLDDLWVAPDFRGTPVVRALFTRIEEIARERAWTHVRWVTEVDNAHAQRLYDRIARKLAFVTYRLDTSDER